MRVVWTRAASADLVRLHAFLAPVAPDAAAHTIRRLVRAPDRLVRFPRLGEKIEGYEPREVRRILAGGYEIRYEVADATIFVLRIWHSREDRSERARKPTDL